MFPYRSTLLSLSFTLALMGAMGGYESAIAQDSGTLTLTDKSAADELAFWNQIKDSQNPADFKNYLLNFPSGMFVDPALRKFEQAGGQKSDLPAAVFAKDASDDVPATVEQSVVPVKAKAKAKKVAKVKTKKTVRVSHSKQKTKRIVRAKVKAKSKRVASVKPRKARSGAGLAQPVSLRCESGRIVNGRCVVPTVKKRRIPFGDGGNPGGGWGG